MNTLTYIIVYSLLGGVISLIGGVLLLSKKSIADSLAKYVTPFAAGALLAAVFLDLLKEGIEQTGAYSVLVMTLVGIVLFFFLERFLHWFHHHHSHDNSKTDPSAGLVIVGDTLHNALDGVAIAASFLISIPTGIVTTIAVAAHEIPQEIGDFGILLNKGVSRKNVLLVNVFSALATTAAAVLVYFFGTAHSESIGLLFGLSAGFLLYIAMSDLIPEIHESSPKQRFFSWQPLLLLLGVITVSLSINLAHRYITEGHSHTETHQEECVTYYDKSGNVVLWDDCEPVTDHDH